MARREKQQAMRFQHTTREGWLVSLADRIVTELFEGELDGKPYRITCGWPSRGANLSSGKGRIGECWDRSASEDGTAEIIVSMTLTDPEKIAGVVAHELCHAALGSVEGHGPRFRALATRIGLEGKMTATTESDAFKQSLSPILEQLGPYPHGALNMADRKKQSTRLIKVLCHSCGCNLRMTRKWLDQSGTPTCGCGHEMGEVQ